LGELIIRRLTLIDPIRPVAGSLFYDTCTTSLMN